MTGTAASLLFIVPILPAETGNGLAMRAGVFLDALARDFAVSLLVVPLAGPVGRLSPFVSQRTRRVVVLDLAPHLDPLWALCERLIEPQARTDALAAYPRPALCRYATTPLLGAAQTALAGASFQAVHVMRSYLAPYAAPFLSSPQATRRPYASLDLDDDECLAQQRNAELRSALGQPLEAQLAAAEAAKYVRHEADWLPRFDCLIAGTTAHAKQLAERHPDRSVAVVANSVALPPRWGRRWWPFGRHILFVGNLSYLPNVDGIVDFVIQVLPRLQARYGRSLSLRIAGSAPAAEVRQLAGQAGIELHADPADLRRHYRWADLAVIPIRAGGGTRIKMLEAFAHGVPVVASRIGAEGIDAIDGRHLRLAEGPESFANACAELLDDKTQAAGLADNARRLVESHYAHEVAVASIRSALAGGGVAASAQV